MLRSKPGLDQPKNPIEFLPAALKYGKKESVIKSLVPLAAEET